MFKLLALACVFLALASVHSQSCSSTTALRSLYGFSNSLTTAQTYSDLKYCKSLKNASVCCTDTDINSIADKSAAMIANLTANVATRDIFLKNALTTTLPALEADLNNLITVSEKFESFMNISLSDFSDFGFDSSDIDINLSDFSDINLSDFSDLDFSDFNLTLSDFSDLDFSDFSDINLSDFDLSDFSDINLSDFSDINLSDFDLSDLDLSDLDLSDFDSSDFNIDFSDSDTGDFGDFGDFFSFIATLQTASTLLSTGASALQASYIAYQQARVTCVEAMVNYQNAAYCLACNPSATTNGYTAPHTISMSTTVCSRLKNACSAYFDAADTENQLIYLSYSDAAIKLLATVLTDVMNNDEAALTSLASSVESIGVTTNYGSYLTTPAYLPASDSWVCDSLFSNGQLDQESLTVGGTFDTAETDETFFDSRRLLQGLAKSKAAEDRVLTNGEYNPDSDEAGVSVVFPQDPANTDSSSSSKKFGSMNLGNVFVGMMVVISSILLI